MTTHRQDLLQEGGTQSLIVIQVLRDERPEGGEA
jgi:hypothetical protein